jgi:hypothetical protein
MYISHFVPINGHIEILLLNWGLVMQTCNPSTLEAEAGRLRVQGQPGLHSDSLTQKNIFF